MQPVKLAVFDFDNTLWDYNTSYDASMEALIDGIQKESGLFREEIIAGFKQVGDKYRVLEDHDFINEHPILRQLFPGVDLEQHFAGAVRGYRKVRAESLKLYEGVNAALLSLKDQGVEIACYSESNARNVALRCRELGLDGIIDVLYTPRARYDANTSTATDEVHFDVVEYGLTRTLHKAMSCPFPKNCSRTLLLIIRDRGVAAENTVMIGDSIVRDIDMANGAGVRSIYAAYGHVAAGPVMLGTSPWTAEMVADYVARVKKDIRPFATAEHPADILTHIKGPQLCFAGLWDESRAA